MNLVTYNISLDLYKTATQVFLSAIKGDTSRVIVASLLEDGKLYQITEGCQAKFNATKPDGTQIQGNVCSIENNNICYRFTEQTTAEVGTVECEFVLTDTYGNQLSSPKFTIIVSDTVFNENAIISSNEFSELKEKIAEMNNLKNELETKLENGDFVGGDGYTPIKGIDYFTEADKQEIVVDVIARLPVYDGSVV